MIIIKETKSEWDKWVLVPVKIIKRKVDMGKLTVISSALCQFSADILQYISLVFTLTGIYAFQPDLLMKYLDIPFEYGMTIEKFWQQSFIAIAPILITLKMFWPVFRFDSVIAVKRLISMVVAAIVIFNTGFDGDRLLWTFAFWILINLFTNYLTKEEYITGMPKEVVAKSEEEVEQKKSDKKYKNYVKIIDKYIPMKKWLEIVKLHPISLFYAGWCFLLGLLLCLFVIFIFSI